METALSGTALTDEALSDLWADAMAAASPFANPALLIEARSVMHLADDAWLTRIIGRPVTAHQWPHLTNVELDVAVRAVKADRSHLNALTEAKLAEYRRAEEDRRRAAAAAAQAERDAWQALRVRLPVPVTVGHNWTARHLDPYVQGADHIVVQADLTTGRFRRKARSPLCWAPSRSHELRHVELRDDGEDRIPTCKACLRHAERLAES